jgi:hypothetical protein
MSQFSQVQQHAHARSRNHADWPQIWVCVTIVASSFAALLQGHLSPWLNLDKRIVHVGLKLAAL